MAFLILLKRLFATAFVKPVGIYITLLVILMEYLGK